jgi:hypothetical protein
MLIDARPLFHVLASDRSQYGNITKDTKTELFEQEPTEGTEDNLTALLAAAPVNLFPLWPPRPRV